MIERIAGYLRYLAAAAVTPSLRGRRIRLGPRIRLTVGRTGRFLYGERCTVDGDFRAVVDGVLHLGDDVYFNAGAHLSVMERVVVGARCRFGERLSIHDEDHTTPPGGGAWSGYVTSPVVIGDDVWVGANVTILRGALIGPHSVVAAGAVVRGRFPEGGVLLAGVPARVVRRLD